MTEDELRLKIRQLTQFFNNCKTKRDRCKLDKQIRKLQEQLAKRQERQQQVCFP